jgi:hypothetical protein
MELKDILYFDKMLTPKIITVVYWLGILGVVLGALAMLFSGEFLYAIGMLFGLLLVRIYCELMIVAFKINESLQVIRNK